MLPPGFNWIPRHQYANREIALALDGEQVAMLLESVDGDWTARLDVHHPIDAPLVLRRCTNFERGKAGVETWARLHETRLRAEVAAIKARRGR